MTSIEKSGFSSLDLDPKLVAALAALGYEEPTPIQRAAIPVLLSGKDVLGQAATGTGKTAAFALPLIQRIAQDKKSGATQGLVLVPTRELAIQVAEAVHRYGRPLGVSVLPIYGGQAMILQLRALKRGVNVVVGTPGRVLDHLRRQTLDISKVTTVVLDEADEMLDMGFAEDLEAILGALPETRQTTLFSATMPKRIAAIASKYLRKPEHITIVNKVEANSVPLVRQVAYVVSRGQKLAALGRLLDMETPTSAIVFCRTRTDVDELSENLSSHGYRTEALHGGLSQAQRDRVMKRFKERAVDIIVATDVAARGLDIKHLSHVFNYDVPSAPDAYVHRIGRTGRAGKEGVAIVIADSRELSQLRNIERITKQRIEQRRIPTVADLRQRQLELVRASIEESLTAGGFERYASVINELSAAHDLMDIAAAAIKLVDEKLYGARAGEERDIPQPYEQRPGARAESRVGAKAESRVGAKAEPRAEPRVGAKAEARGDDSRPERFPARKERHPVEWETAQITIGAGKDTGMRAADVVGVITNGLGYDRRAVGHIEIHDQHTIVEVPEEIADEVVEALKPIPFRGKKVPIKRAVAKA